MSKLKNIKALNEMLQGTHRRQTRKTFGFSDVAAMEAKNRTRELGEIWEETDFYGNTIWWEQKDGYRRKHRVHPSISDEFQKIQDYFRTFPNCQKESCTCLNPSRLDEKFRRLVGMCEDCLITMETRLKIQGKFNEYALDKMKANAESFFKQADVEVEILKKELQNINLPGDEHGDPIEKWNFQNPEGFLKYIDENYLKFKEKTMEKFNAEQTNNA